MLDEIVTVISRDDAVMRSILAYANIPRPSKKVKIPRQVYPRKTSFELWDSILGKRIKTVREEIARIGVNHFPVIIVNFGWIFVFLFLFLKKLSRNVRMPISLLLEGRK